ncbi:hypothetical protein JCM21738_4974 [Mesobacillus boroniphilus JCM 21738]|uniref:Uncharacterized protein n=1 Tax=Mesobacillus boroniphilus JCM 21738 TaxID=1294265 RepID=W4RU62_9BACI|nr:hypothetical protein JCM21738_4974 [Mesobacillus boroniphilus JCM 21738]
MKREQHKKKKGWKKIVLIIFLLIIAAVGAYAFSVYQSLNKAVDTMHEPISREKSDKRTDEVTLDKKEPSLF